MKIIFFGYPMFTQNYQQYTQCRCIHKIVARSHKRCCRGKEINIFLPISVEKNRITNLRPIIFLRNSSHFLNNVEIYCRTGQAPDDNMTFTHYILGK